MSVQAVIVNFQTAEMTGRSIRSLLASETTGFDLDLTVVDNGSDDGSHDWLRDRFPCVRHLQAPRNLGYAGGNNLALEDISTRLSPDIDADSTYVLLMNSDVLVEADTLRQTVDFMRSHPETGVVGPRVLLPNGKLDLACRRSFPTLGNSIWKLLGLARRFPNNRRFAHYNLTYLDELESAEVDAVMGAFMLVRYKAIQQAGFLDDRFFFYGEDLDWAYRIKAHGWRVVYFPRATVHHLKGGTARRHANRMIVEFYRAMWLFYRKHYAKQQFFLLRLAVLTGIVVRGTLALGVNALRPANQKRIA